VAITRGRLAVYIIANLSTLSSDEVPWASDFYLGGFSVDELKHFDKNSSCYLLSISSHT